MQKLCHLAKAILKTLSNLFTKQIAKPYCAMNFSIIYPILILFRMLKLQKVNFGNQLPNYGLLN